MGLAEMSDVSVALDGLQSKVIAEEGLPESSNMLLKMWSEPAPISSF